MNIRRMKHIDEQADRQINGQKEQYVDRQTGRYQKERQQKDSACGSLSTKTVKTTAFCCILIVSGGSPFPQKS